MDRGEVRISIDEHVKTREVCDPALRESQRQELVNSFYESETYYLVKKEISNALKRNDIDSSNVQGSLSGRVFESIALNYYYTNLSPNPENEALARFLQETLISPDVRRIDFYVEGGLRSDFNDNSEVPKDKKQDNKSPDSKLVLSESETAFANPDALLVDVQTDANNRKVARIIGAIDAKVKGGIDAKQRDGFKESLWRLVKKLKPHYGEVIKSLGIAGDLPEQIDIEDDINKLGVKVIRPQNYPDNVYSLTDNNSNSIVVPITRNEITEIVASITNEVIGKKTQKTQEGGNKNSEGVETKFGAAFVLKVNKNALEKYDESGSGAKFLDTWVNFQDNITGVVFTKDETKLVGVTLNLTNGEKIDVPIHVFRKMFLDDIVLPAPKEDPIGIRLKSSDGLVKYIFPNTPKRLAKEGEDWKNIIKRISINGIFLGNNVSITMK